VGGRPADACRVVNWVVWIGDKKKRELMSDKLKADPKPET
jgi:hypothetical protein